MGGLSDKRMMNPHDNPHYRSTVRQNTHMFHTQTPSSDPTWVGKVGKLRVSSIVGTVSFTNSMILVLITIRMTLRGHPYGY